MVNNFLQQSEMQLEVFSDLQQCIKIQWKPFMMRLLRALLIQFQRHSNTKIPVSIAE